MFGKMEKEGEGVCAYGRHGDVATNRTCVGAGHSHPTISGEIYPEKRGKCLQSKKKHHICSGFPHFSSISHNCRYFTKYCIFTLCPPFSAADKTNRVPALQPKENRITI